jgi:transposase-like protein
VVVHQSGVTIKEAARILGISEAAVRQRLLRRTLTSTRQNGHVFVLLPEDTSDATVDDTIPAPDDTSDDTANVPLVTQLRDEIGFLRGQVDIKDRQIGELHVLLQTAQRQLAASVPSSAPPETFAEESPIKSANVAPGGVPREIRPSWWRRLFGME